MDNGILFLGPTSKTYFIRKADQSSVWKGKGIMGDINDMIEENYREAIFNKEATLIENRGFKYSKEFLRVFSYKVVKRGITYFYAKRRVLEDSYHTVSIDLKRN